MSMKLNKLKTTFPGQKVDHPLAKYNSKGDLYCLLCNAPIKNANVWKVHLSSRSHKENLILFKAGKTRTTDSLKRSAPKVEEAPPRSLKKTKPNNISSIDSKPQSESVDSSSRVENPFSAVKTGILKQSSKVVPKLPEGFVPKSRLVKEKTEAISKPVQLSSEQVRAVEIKSNLPSGFFDDNVTLSIDTQDQEPESSEGMEEEKDHKSKNPASTLPDGFFDDAREDAKARKVEYKDPQELEWEKYQSEMEQEDIRYNTILEEDDQKLREERDVGIGIEQKLWDYRVESMAESVKTGEICLLDKQAFENKLKNEKLEPNEVKNESSDIKEEVADIDVKMETESIDSDDDDDDVMDWRVKRGV